jgi:hypothetical protein
MTDTRLAFFLSALTMRYLDLTLAWLKNADKKGFN